jgi:hypothetical protein
MEELFSSNLFNEKFEVPLYLFKLTRPGSSIIYDAGGLEFFAEEFRQNNGCFEFMNGGLVRHSYPSSFGMNAFGPYTNLKSIYEDDHTNSVLPKSEIVNMYIKQKSV